MIIQNLSKKFQKQRVMLPLWNKGNCVFEKVNFKFGLSAAE